MRAVQTHMFSPGSLKRSRKKRTHYWAVALSHILICVYAICTYLYVIAA